MNHSDTAPIFLPSLIVINGSKLSVFSLTLPLCYHFDSQLCHAHHRVCHRQADDKGNLGAFDRVSVACAKPFKHAPSKLMAHSEGRKWIASKKERCVDSLKGTL